MLFRRHNVSFEAARAVLFAVVAGGGPQAQLTIPIWSAWGNGHKAG
jgi:hypothetical protein